MKATGDGLYRFQDEEDIQVFAKAALAAAHTPASALSDESVSQLQLGLSNAVPPRRTATAQFVLDILADAGRVVLYFLYLLDDDGLQ